MKPRLFQILAMTLLACSSNPPIGNACIKYYGCYRAPSAWDDDDCEYDFGSRKRSEPCIQCVETAVCAKSDAGIPAGQHDFASCASLCPGLKL